MTVLQETGPSVPSSDKSTVRVAVVFGGRSGEHTISCATAAGVLSAIDRDRYEVLPVGITPEGQWLLVEDDPAALELSDNRPPVTITAGVVTVVEGAASVAQVTDALLARPRKSEGVHAAPSQA